METVQGIEFKYSWKTLFYSNPVTLYYQLVKYEPSEQVRANIALEFEQSIKSTKGKAKITYSSKSSRAIVPCELCKIIDVAQSKQTIVAYDSFFRKK